MYLKNIQNFFLLFYKWRVLNKYYVFNLLFLIDKKNFLSLLLFYYVKIVNEKSAGNITRLNFIFYLIDVLSICNRLKINKKI